MSPRASRATVTSRGVSASRYCFCTYLGGLNYPSHELERTDGCLLRSAACYQKLFSLDELKAHASEELNAGLVLIDELDRIRFAASLAQEHHPLGITGSQDVGEFEM